MTIHLPSLTALFALLACVVLGAAVGWLGTGLSSLFDFSLDCWWSYEVVPRIFVPLMAVGAACGVWFWAVVLL